MRCVWLPGCLLVPSAAQIAHKLSADFLQGCGEAFKSVLVRIDHRGMCIGKHLYAGLCHIRYSSLG